LGERKEILAPVSMLEGRSSVRRRRSSGSAAPAEGAHAVQINAAGRVDLNLPAMSASNLSTACANAG
jgi:hypothetical protein